MSSKIMNPRLLAIIRNLNRKESIQNPRLLAIIRNLNSKEFIKNPRLLISAINMDEELGDFEYHSDIIRTVGMWRYEDPGDGRLIPAEKTVVRCNFASRTGVAFIKKGTENGIDIPELATAYEAWVQFDVYAYGHYNDSSWSSIACYFKSNGNKSSGIQIFNAESSTGDTIRIWSNETKQKYFTDVFYGLHTVKMHIKSSTTNGLIELYIDSDTSPYASYSGNVNQGEALHTFFIRCNCSDTTKNKILVSNLIVTNIMPPSINDVVSYEKEEYKYTNLGTADKLTVGGTTVQGYTYSNTGKAFYQTARPVGGCFGVPMMDEVWMRFDLYHKSGTSRFRCYANNDFITGICLEENSANKVLSWMESNNFTSVAKLIPNTIQTYIVHMVSGAKTGKVEVWLDNEQIINDTCSKVVSPFRGLYFQSDNDSNLFSNVIVSDKRENLIGATQVTTHFDLAYKICKTEQRHVDIVYTLNRGYEHITVNIDIAREVYKTEQNHIDIKYESIIPEESHYDVRWFQCENNGDGFFRWTDPGDGRLSSYTVDTPTKTRCNFASKTGVGLNYYVLGTSNGRDWWFDVSDKNIKDIWIKFDVFLTHTGEFSPQFFVSVAGRSDSKYWNEHPNEKFTPQTLSEAMQSSGYYVENAAECVGCEFQTETNVSWHPPFGVKRFVASNKFGSTKGDSRTWWVDRDTPGYLEIWHYWDDDVECPTLSGLHSITMHCIAHEQDGLIEVYLDNNETPMFRYHNPSAPFQPIDINKGRPFEAVWIGSDLDCIVSNIIISEIKPSVDEIVPYVKQPYQYINEGTAEGLLVDGITVYPTDKSITGTAFYQTTTPDDSKFKIDYSLYDTSTDEGRAKYSEDYGIKKQLCNDFCRHGCFDIPAMDDVWVKFDLYHHGDSIFRCFCRPTQKGELGGLTVPNIGVELQQNTTNIIDLCIGDNLTNQDNNIKKRNANVVVPDTIQTYVIHIKSGDLNGLIEVWVDGQKAFNYTHNRGIPALYGWIMQSDDENNLFSNVLITDDEQLVRKYTFVTTAHYDVSYQSNCSFEYHGDIAYTIGRALMQVDNYFDIVRIIGRTVVNHFDIRRNVCKSILVENHFDTFAVIRGLLYYEDPGDSSNKICYHYSGRIDVKFDPHKSISRTGVAIESSFGLSDKDLMYPVPCYDYGTASYHDSWEYAWTKDIWIKFDVYGNEGGKLQFFFNKEYRLYNDLGVFRGHVTHHEDITFRFSSSELSNGFAVNDNVNSNAGGGYNEDTRTLSLIGLHSIKIHLVSHRTNGVIDVYIDDDNDPFYTYRGNVSYGDYFAWFSFSMGDDVNHDVSGLMYVSNIVISSTEPSLSYVVPYNETEYPVTTHADIERDVQNLDYVWRYENPGVIDNVFNPYLPFIEVHNSTYSRTGVGLTHEYNDGYPDTIELPYSGSSIPPTSGFREWWVKFDVYCFWQENETKKYWIDPVTGETYVIFGADGYPSFSCMLKDNSDSGSGIWFKCSKDSTKGCASFHIMQWDAHINDNTSGDYYETKNLPFYGFHTVKLHIKSHRTDGIFEVYVDNENVNEPFYRYVGDVNDGLILYELEFGLDSVILSNLIVSNRDIDMNEIVRYESTTILPTEGIATHKTIDLGRELNVGIGINLDGEGYAMIRTAGNDGRYTEWANYVPCERLCRYIDAQLHVRNILKEGWLTIDRRSVDKTISKHLSAGENKVEYGEAFYNVPAVIPTAIGDGKTASIISKGNESCVIKITDSSGNPVEGDVDIWIRGW